MATTPPQLASATVLDDVVLPALTLARAAVTGINIPGVEGTLNGLLELATMLSTMKANKDDLSKLKQSLKKVIDISTAGVDGDLKARLNMLSSELGKNLSECEALAGESLFRRFIQSKPYKERIQAIKDSIASQIHNFTVWIFKKDILAASFFFSRDYPERTEITCLPTTLAKHLADYDVTFRNCLTDFLDNDRTGILDTKPDTQFQKLVVEILGNYLQVKGLG
ncbi:hypothetical protein B0H19DRAFT_1377843 [Mycena capillaripes]|nr:hypothetical protein B0H19DRAFT_1377843 [Mycena capillaripes]